MKVIRPNCRDRFSQDDFDFIATTLGALGDQQFLLELLTDPDSRDLLLDDDKLTGAVLDNPECIAISPQLYFYVLVRQTLRRTGVQNRELTDYVAAMLADFMHRDAPRRSLPDNVKDDSYLFEMLAALRDADTQTSFQIRAHIGNRTLFMTGICADNLRERTRRRGAPDLEFYESVGASSFREASRNRLAGEFDVARVYEALGEQFRRTRLALNEMTDRHLSLGDIRPPENLLLN